MQTTFETAFDRMQQLRDPNALPAWLLQIAVRRCQMLFRRPVEGVVFALAGIEGGVSLVGARALAGDAAVGGTIGGSIGARAGVGLSF